MSSSPSFSVLVIGFSTKVLTPAPSVLDATARWVEAGVQTLTPSSLSCLSISSIELYPLTWYLVGVILRPCSRRRRRRRPGAPSSLSALTWFFPHPPVPITAILVNDESSGAASGPAFLTICDLSPLERRVRPEDGQLGRPRARS